MMATYIPSCGVCEYRQIFKLASIWCSECDEGLCNDCKEHHGISKATRKHGTISISDYQKLPDYIRNIKHICSTHDEKYHIYCNEHECACCSKCIVEAHTKCQNIVNLDDVVKDTKASNAFVEIQETLNEIAENIERIRQDKNNNLKTLSKNRNHIECEIQLVRLTINQHLDKLQENIIAELHEIEKRESRKISLLIKALDEHEIKVAEHQKNITYIKQNASDLQTFLALKQLEADVDEKYRFIDSLSESESLSRVEIKFNINTSLTDITNTLPVFGNIYIDFSQSVIIAKKKEQQAQSILPGNARVSIENMTAELQLTINTEHDIRGCCILSDGRIVLSYPTLNRVIVVKEDGTVDFYLSVAAAFGVAYNNEDNTLAISSSLGNAITIIDLTQRKIIKTISPGGGSFGIATINNKLIYQVHNLGILAMDLSDKSIRTITTEKKDTIINLTISGNNLYYSTSRYHRVVCCDLVGTTKWSFKDKSIVNMDNSSCGISSDNDGNVFVVGYGTNNVVVISHNGQKHKELLSIKDGITSPCAINFGRATNQLLVTTDNHKVYLYKVSSS